MNIQEQTCNLKALIAFLWRKTKNRLSFMQVSKKEKAHLYGQTKEILRVWKCAHCSLPLLMCALVFTCFILIYNIKFDWFKDFLRLVKSQNKIFYETLFTSNYEFKIMLISYALNINYYYLSFLSIKNNK